MRRLFLHIGAHKTGTTALQQSLYHNREALAERGAQYVSTPGVAHLHRHLGPAAAGQLLPGGYSVTEPDALASLLASAPGDLVLASSENFSFFFHRPAIEALAQLLRPHFAEIRIISYLRRQDRHAISHHQEGAKPHRAAECSLWGTGLAALPDPSPNHALYLDYARRLGLWADVFGDAAMDLRLYDRASLKDGDIFADFLDRTGVDRSGLATVGERNTSLGAGQAKAGHLMNRLGIRPRIMENVLERIGPEGRLLPSRDEARAFLAPYREGNRQLNARFRLTDHPDLFPDDFSDLPEAPQSDWTEATATAALTAALGHVGEPLPAFAALSADDLRNAAIALQQKQPEAALRLITAAQALRPNGPTILKVKAELESKLGQAQ